MRQTRNQKAAAAMILPKTTRQRGDRLRRQAQVVRALQLAVARAPDARQKALAQRQLKEATVDLMRMKGVKQSPAGAKSRAAATTRQIPAGSKSRSLPRIRLPTHYAVPDAGKVLAISRAVGTQVERAPRESDAAFQARIRAYTKRAVLRYLKHQQKLSDARALNLAVVETVQQDVPLMGEGDTLPHPEDRVAQQLIGPAVANINEIVEDMHPYVPESDGDLNEVELQELIIDAEAQAADLLTAPEEPLDAVQISDKEEGTPLYKNPYVVGSLSALGLGVAILLIRRM